MCASIEVGDVVSTYITILELNKGSHEATISDIEGAATRWLTCESGPFSLDVWPGSARVPPLHQHLVLHRKLSFGGWDGVGLERCGLGTLGWSLCVTTNALTLLGGLWGSWWEWNLSWISLRATNGNSAVTLAGTAALIVGLLGLDSLNISLSGKLIWSCHNWAAISVKLWRLWSSLLACSLWEWVAIGIDLWSGGFAWGLLEWVAVSVDLWLGWGTLAAWSGWSGDLLVGL